MDMDKAVWRNRKGFTLIEVIVVAAIIAILAGILVPMIFNQIDEAKISRAQGDVKSISSAIMVFRKDTGQWPNRTDPATAASNTVKVLSSTGAALTPALNWTAPDANLIDYLGGANTLLYPTAFWKGPYMASVDADPWGNTYLVGAKNFEDITGKPVWVISAGPDGIIQTPLDGAVCYDNKTVDPATGATHPGDDICQRLK
jgi:general secretion pathway protein G